MAPGELDAVLSGADVAIDAVFGFGFSGPARGHYAEALRVLSESRLSIVAADVPSGVDSDTGVVGGLAVTAVLTVTFSAQKPGLLIYPGAAHAGEVVVADLGIAQELLAVPDALELPDTEALAHLMPRARPADHKGSRGRVAIVAGSLAYSGAVVLAAQGALRMGAGYVYAVVPDRIADVVRVALPNVIVRAAPSASDGSLADAATVLAAVTDADAVVAGPGLTQGPGVRAVVGALVEDASQPLLLDADALNVFAGRLGDLHARTAPLVLTPHPGEASRLLGVGTDELAADRVSAAASLGGPSAVALLKGPPSVVAGRGRQALVLAGDPGLARAGSGDVLSGMIGTLLAQGVSPYDAATLGAHLHGRAAEIGTRVLTQECFTSTDIAGYIPDAVRELLGG
jgi:NAD(P)H-hydrate epimerase